MGWFLDEIPIILQVGLLVVVLGLFLLGYTVAAQFIGFGSHEVKKTETFEYRDGEDEPVKTSETHETQASRTFWDWMTVLTISAVIGVVALMFTHRQAQQQQDIQNQQANDDALQAYLDQMTQMTLDSKVSIRDWTADSEEGVAARVQTVTALNRLDGAHNKIVLTFLKESDLVNFGLPGDQRISVVRLDQTDLNSVDLAHNNLSGFNLRFAQLRDADLHDANLSIANLTFADLRDANLFFANLDGANLDGAKLSGVDLSGADLKTAKNLTQEQIGQASAGDSATRLPDGLRRPSRWSNTNPLTDPRLRASLVALKSLKPEIVDEIGLPEEVGTSGALVYDVQPDGLADDARLLTGDIIVNVGGKQVHGPEDLKDKLGEYAPGKRVEFSTWRRYFQGWDQGRLDARLGDQGAAT